jgi:hypothetical protein
VATPYRSGTQRAEEGLAESTRRLPIVRAQQTWAALWNEHPRYSPRATKQRLSRFLLDIV